MKNGEVGMNPDITPYVLVGIGQFIAIICAIGWALKEHKKNKKVKELRQNPPAPLLGTITHGELSNEGRDFDIKCRLQDGTEFKFCVKKDTWKAVKELEVGSTVRVLHYPGTKIYVLADYE